MTIGVLLLATHKYKQFVQSLLNDIRKHFLLDCKIEVHLFADDINIEYEIDERISLHQELISSWRFPEITLYRYRVFTHKKYPNCDYLVYMDVDMSIVGTIDGSMLGDIIAVLHPGFYNGGGAWGNNKESLSYTFPENRIKYFAGGVQGGQTEKYWYLMKRMALEIEDDEKRGVLAEWHDETFWNRCLSELKSFKVLTPVYCMPEPVSLREQWGINQFSPKILALDKNHEEIRK